MSSSSKKPPRRILNCGVRFDFVCDRNWLDLEETADHPSTPHKRFCDACKKDVYWCVNVQEAALRIEQGECIAVPAIIAERWPDEQPIVIIGRGSAIQDTLEALYLDLSNTQDQEER